MTDERFAELMERRDELRRKHEARQRIQPVRVECDPRDLEDAAEAVWGDYSE